MKRMKKLLYLIMMLPILFLIGCSSDIGIEPDLQDTVKPEERDEPEPEPSEASEAIIEPEEDTDPEKDTEPDTGTEVITDPSGELTDEEANIQRFGFIDAHADTISRALQLGQGQQDLFDNSTLHIDFKRLSEFDAPVQVFVAWCEGKYVPMAFEQTNRMFDFFEQEVAKNSELVEIALDLEDIRRISSEGKISAILAIEGGEALMGSIANLEHFFNRGVRILGLTWNRENELGFGQATGSGQGLKPFGIECVQKMDELGMIVDVSHLNEAGFWDVHKTSTRPYMASHSNTYSILQHNRNLKDDQITAIVESGGIIGFNMYPAFITSNRTAVIDDIMTHFKHFIQIGAGSNIGLGCDFDGIDSTPEGITNVSSLKMFEESLSEEFNEETSYKIMEGNFYDFFKRYFEG